MHLPLPSFLLFSSVKDNKDVILVTLGLTGVSLVTLSLTGITNYDQSTAPGAKKTAKNRKPELHHPESKRTASFLSHLEGPLRL